MGCSPVSGRAAPIQGWPGLIAHHLSYRAARQSLRSPSGNRYVFCEDRPLRLPPRHFPNFLGGVMANKNDYQGKVIVITGASSGFGRGTALELARRGASVVLAARSAETLADLARACENAGGLALAVPTDVSERAAVE